MAKKIKLAKKPAAEKPKASAPVPAFEKTAEPTAEVPKGLPLVGGVQAIEVIEETATGTHYRLADQTTTWVAK